MPVYPGALTSFTAITGTTLVADDGHANRHNTEGSAIVAIETVLGTNSGTSVLMNCTAGDFAVRINAGGTVKDTLTLGTVNNFVMGSPTVTSGTFTSSVIRTATVGTPNISAGTVTSGTLNQCIVGSPTVTGGTINSVLMGTPTITGGSIGVSGTTVPLSIGAGIVPTVSTLTDSAGGTIFPNAQAGQVFVLSLGTAAGSRIIGNPYNPTSGQAINLQIKQNTGNTGTVGWGTIYRFSSDFGTPSLGTEATWNYYNWRYNAGDTRWDFQGQVKNVIA